VLSDYGNIRQRWLIVFSEVAQLRAEQGLERKQAKELETAGIQWRKLMQERFNYQADDEQALAQFNQKLHYHQVHASLEKPTANMPAAAAQVHKINGR
jgi:transposase